MKRRYKVLKENVVQHGAYRIQPLADATRYAIMEWRNSQLFHLRQKEPLTEEQQDKYFEQVISPLFEQDQPNQILFNYYYKEKVLGYGGLVHIDWQNNRAEVSFVMNTELQEKEFELHWFLFTKMLQEIAFNGLSFHKIFTYAYDLRPRLYPIIEKAGFLLEAHMKEHYLFDGKYVDCLIHSVLNAKQQKTQSVGFRKVDYEDKELLFYWATDTDVRSNALTQDEIRFSEHLKWLKSKLGASTTAYEILEWNGVPAGLIRLDQNESSEMEITYLVDALFRGKGLGKMLIEKALELAKGRKLTAVVKKANSASVRIFKDLQFEQQEEGDCLKFNKN